MSVHFVDTTLRDGEQQAGLAFSAADKLRIAHLLAGAGVAAIEAGTPIMGAAEQDALRGIVQQRLSCPVLAWNRARKEDIDASVSCGFEWVHISVPVSDHHLVKKMRRSRSWLLGQLAQSIPYAKSWGCRVTVGAEDASRADPHFFLEVARLAAGLGAERIRYADTVGCLEPFGVYEKMKTLGEYCPLPIEFHGHNDFGLAVANTLAAIEAGIEWVSVTVGGIGERAGNASLEGVQEALVLAKDQKSNMKADLLPALRGEVQLACGS